MTPRYIFFHKIMDCYHLATNRALCCLCEDITFYKFLMNFNNYSIVCCYVFIITLFQLTVNFFFVSASNLLPFPKKSSINLCMYYSVVPIYCQTIFKYTRWIRTIVSLAIPTIQFALCGPLRPKPLDYSTLRNSLTTF
jgi:hypothetical protein